MPFDHDPDEEPTPSEGMLPRDERLWRHPSELGPDLRRSPAAAATVGRPGRGLIAGVVLVGAVVGLGVLWLARSGRTGVQVAEGSGLSVNTTRATTVDLPGAPIDLGALVGPSVALVEVERNGSWHQVSGLWVDHRGTLATSAPALASVDRVYVIGDDGRRQLARVVGAQHDLGVAVIVAQRTEGEPITVAADRPADGDEATVVAPGIAADPTDVVGTEPSLHPTVLQSPGGSWPISDGPVTNMLQLDHAVPDHRVGAAIVDPDGALVGMVVGTGDDGTNATIAPAEAVMSTALAVRDAADG